jgi:hypothetical protein
MKNLTKTKEPKILRDIRIANSNNGKTLVTKMLKNKKIYSRKVKDINIV